MRKENPTEYEMLHNLWRTHYFPHNPNIIREVWEEEKAKIIKENSDYSWKAWKRAFRSFWGIFFIATLLLIAIKCIIPYFRG